MNGVFYTKKNTLVRVRLGEDRRKKRIKKQK